MSSGRERAVLRGSRRAGLRSGTPVTARVLGPARDFKCGANGPGPGEFRIADRCMMKRRRPRSKPSNGDARVLLQSGKAHPPKVKTRGKWRDGGGAAAPAGNKRRALLQFRSQCKGQRAGAPRAALRRRRSSHGARAGETSLSSSARPCAAPFGPRDVCGQDRLVVRLFGGGDNKVRSAADARRRERASPRRTAATTG